MAVQVSYPGVYIDEYAPAAPIEGVSTSIAAFIGIAERGPIGEPTLVTSLDAFREAFGGSVNAATPYYLPLAVQGFFENGGTIAYILRVGTGQAAHADLTAADGTALATVSAIDEGAAGENGVVTVSAVNGTAFAAVVATTAVTAIDGTRRLLTVASSSAFQEGDWVVLTNGTDDSARIRVAGVEAGLIRLATAVAAAPAAGEFDSVSVADPDVGETRIRVTTGGVSLRSVAPAGSVVRITDGTTTVWAVATEVGADSFTLATPLTGVLGRATTTVATAEFNLTITEPGGTARTYSGLSTSPQHPRWWGAVFTDPYARLLLRTAFPTGDPRPKPGTTAVDGATLDNPATSWAAVATGIAAHLKLLEPIDEISLVAAPGCIEKNAQQAIVVHCERQFDRFAILDSRVGNALPLTEIKKQRADLTGTLDKGFAALYYPWLKVYDPVRKAEALQPPSGHVAGIYAQTDQSRGVHKAPANVGIAGAVGLEKRLTDTDHGFINLDGVNALRILPGRGIPVVYGARTTASDRNWQYINVRRLFLYLEESIQVGIGGSVFEPNDLALWQKLKRTITEFLTRTWRDGALFGATAKDAFFVRIDEVLNPPATRKLGRLYVEIGVQPVYPAEFIVVRIGIWDGGSDVAES